MNKNDRANEGEGAAARRSPAVNDYVIRVLTSPAEVDADAWNALLARQSQPTPFMRHEFLLALHETGCASAATGWTPLFFLLERAGALRAACVIYVKSHSQGEFVFDWGWARAYHQHGLDYHPKAVCAVPFTPVTGDRLLAECAADRLALLDAVRVASRELGLTGLHVLFASQADTAALTQAGLRLRHTVQFHWTNTEAGYASFEDFLAHLSQDKRKKIRQERRRVAQAGVSFRVAEGAAITEGDWDLFYRCYERTYLEHGNPPYFSRAFFSRMARDLPGHWVLFVAERAGRPMASSLIAINNHPVQPVAYGRYWGALERVDCLHFEACYYQPLAWCIARGYRRFEGGAQGEHKLARALLPVATTSGHWLTHPQFFAAVDRFLTEEREDVGRYMQVLEQHSPFKQGQP